MRKLFLILLLLNVNCLHAQTDSCSLRISLLTCTPGSALYSTFGHSALRVTDSKMQTDVIYNYGTFDFEDPQFYTKFIRGKLLYFVSIDSIENFMLQYQFEKRGITEQELNLSCEQKQQLLDALNENAKEENRYYQYDFTYDNCTTRLRDLLEKLCKDLTTKNILPKPKVTFRNLIHEYLDKGQQPWSKFGIDILLGSRLDKKISNREAMFLPDYLLKGFDSSSVNNHSLVQEKNVLLGFTETKKPKPLFTPFTVLGILFLLVLVFSFYKKESSALFFKIFDFSFFLLLGLLGALLLFMWFGTDHYMCKYNLNLLWALPFHLPVAFFLFSKKKWVNKYFRIVLFYSLLLLVLWFLLPQHFNPALLFVLGIVIIRSFVLSKVVLPLKH
ncbi:MAG: DUF4105 domain-containing protein [Sphingobacteriales bacterium]|nr:DUF4105 domain-containing protein [Sphingobacteriales bacterium]